MDAPRKRKLILAACCGAHGVQDGLGAALYVLMPILAQAFGLSYAQVGIIRAANSCVMTFLEIPSGVLAERYGERGLLVFGLVSAGIGYMCLSFSIGLWTILASLLVLGVGSAFQHALSSALISNTHDTGNRRSALGIYNSFGDVGKLVFTGLFGLATGIGAAWQGVVAALAIVAFATALFVLYTLRNANAGKPHPGTSDPHDATNPGGDIKGGWGIKDRQGFAALCVTVFLDTAVQTSFLVFVAFVAIEKGVAAHLAAFAVVLTLIGGIFGKAGCGYLAERIGVRQAFVLIQCATAICIVGVIVSPPIIAFMLLPLLGMFLQGSTTITYGAITDVISADRQSRGFAMIYSISAPSAVVGPIGFGYLIDHAGMNTCLMAMAIVSLLAIPPSLLLKIGSEQREAA